MSVAFNCTLGLQSRGSVVKRRNLHTCTLRVRVCIYNTMPVGLYAYVHVLTSQKWAFLPNRTYLRTMGELRSMKNVQPKVCLNIHDAFKAKLLGRWSHLEHSCHSTMRHLKNQRLVQGRAEYSEVFSSLLPTVIKTTLGVSCPLLARWDLTFRKSSTVLPAWR